MPRNGRNSRLFCGRRCVGGAIRTFSGIRRNPHEVRLLLEPLLQIGTDHDPDTDLYENHAVTEDEN